MAVRAAGSGHTRKLTSHQFFTGAIHSPAFITFRNTTPQHVPTVDMLSNVTASTATEW